MASERKPTLSIVIPAYNEEKRIGHTLAQFTDFFRKSGMSYEIIVIMDGCTDGTHAVVSKHARKNRHIRFKEYAEKQGKGGALLRGFAIAGGEHIAYTDADCSTPPQEIMRLLSMIGDYDGIIGSRWLKGSSILRKQRPVRRIASRGFNIMTRLLLGLPYRDTQCPAKIFRSGVLKNIAAHVNVTNFAIDACMLYFIRKKGYRIKEIPIRWEDKDMSSLKMSKAVPRMFSAVLKMRFAR